MEVAVVAFQVRSHTEVIFIFRNFEADSQMEVALVAFQGEQSDRGDLHLPASGGQLSDGGGRVDLPG
jgi:hypothetical protein